jgi:hypothetical protein
VRGCCSYKDVKTFWKGFEWEPIDGQHLCAAFKSMMQSAKKSAKAVEEKEIILELFEKTRARILIADDVLGKQ